MKNNKPSQLDPLPVIMAAGERNAQQKVKSNEVFRTKMKTKKYDLVLQCNCFHESIIFDLTV